MRGGKLDRRITIQDKTEVIDDYGQRTLTWATHLTVWADFTQKDGMEKIDSENRSTKRMTIFKTRYHSTITNEMRVLYDGEYYKIEDIKEIKQPTRQQGLMIITSLLAQT